MRGFFYPESVVVVGVSTKPNNLGKAIVTNLLNAGFKGLIYSVGPKGGVLFGQSIYKSLREIPGPADLAVILTPAATVPDVVDQCGRKGIKRVIIESSGFSEFDQSRKDLENELLEAAKKWGIRFLGPNGIGAINTEAGLAVPFVPLARDIPAGQIAVIAQSGGVGLTYLNLLRTEKLGLSKFVSMGNKLNVNESDLLEYLIHDPQTKVIMMYLEGITDGERLVSLARTSNKPVLIHKANVGSSAHRIASSHTAALTSDDRVVSSAFRQAGIIRVNRFQTALNYFKVLTLPPLADNRLAIVSRSGGHAVIAADACDKYGFRLPSFKRSFLESIESHFRASVIRLDNPLDLGDLFDLELYVQIMDSMLKMDDVDGVLLVHAYADEEEQEPSRRLIREVGSLVERHGKPVAICIVTSDSEVSYIKQHIDFPVFTSPEEAAESLYLSYKKEWWGREHHDRIRDVDADRTRAGEIVDSAKAADQWLSMDQGFRLLECYGIPTIPWQCAVGEEDVLKAARELGYPVALKADVPEVIHKTEAGALQLNIRSPEELREAYSGLGKRLSAADSLKVLVQKMAGKGIELIMGGRRDRQFGSLVVLGLGGIFVELLDDVSIRTAPITERESGDMVDELKGKMLLEGFRGQSPSDVGTLRSCLERLSHLVSDFPAIREIDINPFILWASGEGGAALDVRVKVSHGG